MTSVLNVGQINEFPFKNLFLTGFATCRPVYAANANGYPASNSFTTAGLNPVRLPQNYFGKYRIRWDGTAKLNFSVAPITTYVNSGKFDGTWLSGSFASGTDYVEFDFSTPVLTVTNNGNGLIRITTALVNGTLPPLQCKITGVGTGVDGVWGYTRVDGSTYDLIGSSYAAYSGGYVSGGKFIFSSSSCNCVFSNTGTFSSFGNLILCMAESGHSNDLTDVLSGDTSRMFMDEFINLITGMGSPILRFLDAAAINASSRTRYAYDRPVGYITYGAQGITYANTLVGGGTASITSSPSGVTYTCSAATDTPVSWTDGEIFQGYLDATPVGQAISSAQSSTGSDGGLIWLNFASAHGLSTNQWVTVKNNASGGSFSFAGQGLWKITVKSSTQIELSTNRAGVASVYTGSQWGSGGTVYACTINCGSRGAKPLIGFTCISVGDGSSYSTSNCCTFIYNAALDAVIVNSTSSANLDRGVSNGWPLSVRIALCNKVAAGYWHQFPLLYDQSSVSSEATYIANNLNGRAYYECSNEVWNTGGSFTQTYQAYAIGNCYTKTGVTWGSDDYLGLVFRQTMGTVSSVYSGLSKTNYTRILAWKAVDGGVLSTTAGGTKLNGTTFPNYAAAGFPNYDTAPNRPVDYADAFSFATYFDGGVLAFNATISSSATLTDISGLTGACDNYNLGTTAGINAAFSWMDTDISYGMVDTRTISSYTGSTFTLNSHGLANGDLVNLSSSGNLPTGITANQGLFVVSSATNTFGLATSSGGSAISVSGATGTLSIARTASNSFSLLRFKRVYYPQWLTNLQTYNITQLIIYEGAYDGGAPQSNGTTFVAPYAAVTYTNGGAFFSGGYCYNMLTAYKSSFNFYQICRQQISDIIAAFPGVTVTPSWYTFGGSSGAGVGGSTYLPADDYIWSMLRCDPFGFYEAAVFQSYYATKNYNTNKRRFKVVAS